MNFDKKVLDGNLIIYCSNDLLDFSYEFINYYKENIGDIKSKLMINKDIILKVALFDIEKQNSFIYGKSDFSGFFNDIGAYAYINLYGEKNKECMFKGLMHELTHHLYKYYVYGKDKKRITWVDEGIAQYISGQKEELLDDNTYNDFLKDNLKDIDQLELNKLNHDDRSFGKKNGYNLSYIAIRYLFETNKHKDFIDIISDYDVLIKIGDSVLKGACSYYDINGNKCR